MARVAVVCPDLLFGSRVEGMLRAGGHEIVRPGEPADAAVVDLTDDAEARIAGAPSGMPRLAFYSHVEHDVRLRAQEAGFELVVPRSRMAREGAALVDRLLAS
ncbi:MAG: hypothetical protein WD844_15940 [Thermoleophilaceae bacterium]